MRNKPTNKKKLLMYKYKTQQFLNTKWIAIKKVTIRFTNSIYFYFIIYFAFILLIHMILMYSGLKISHNIISGFAFAVASIIGASIAIIFSFSTFILQSTSDLFSTQYLNKFIENKKEKIYFWLLVVLSICAFLTPVITLPRNLINILSKYPPNYYRFDFLISIFLLAFYLIYSLYRDLRKNINPESTLFKIKNDSIKQLEIVNRKLKKQVKIQNKIIEQKEENKELLLDLYYKANRNWYINIIENIKCLFEIGLRLLAKNEINASNLVVKFIHDIHLKHLQLRNGSFIKMPASLWGTFSFDDEGFTIQVLDYLQSFENRIIHEKRRENAYYLLTIYENIISHSLNIQYEDNTYSKANDNPLLNLVIAYYVSLIDNLTQSKENDWIWKAIQSISKVSNITIQITNNHLMCNQINQSISKISQYCYSNNQTAYLIEIVKIYFNQINNAWNKHDHDTIFWKNLFKEFKVNLLLLSGTNDPGLSVGELFINFQSWQVRIANWIFELEDEKQQKENLNKFTKLLKRWSDFLLDFSRDMGLNNQIFGHAIIQSIDENLRIIHGINNEFTFIDFDKIYKTQFNTFSWYFKNTTEVKDSYLFNLEEVLHILLREIRENATKRILYVDFLVKIYIRLVEQHFEKADFGYGYNHPRIIEKLVYLGLILNKYKQKQELIIISKIDELINKYLEINKDYFKLKQEKQNMLGSDKHQLCKEIHELKDDLFSFGRNDFMDMKNILKQEISIKEWDDFINKIEYCKNVEHKPVKLF